MATSTPLDSSFEIEAQLKSLRSQHGSKSSLLTRGDIVDALGCTDRRARTLQEKIRKGKVVQMQPVLADKHERTENTWGITLPATNIHTLEGLIEYCQVDLTVWEVEKFVAKKWEMGSVGTDGKPTTTPLFQVKAWLKRKQAESNVLESVEKLKAELKAEFKGIRSPYKPIIRSAKKSGYMLEVNIPDLHVGKLAWSQETGYQDYDAKIAVNLFNTALESIIDRSGDYRFDKILFVVGNDLLHTDNRQGTTEAGTPVDTDGRYHKSFLSARRMITSAIERLRLLAPVDVVVVPGNHDTLSAWHLGDSLECTFMNCPDVTIDNTPLPRKYYQFGKVMLMLTHGNKGKLLDYPVLMAVERPGMFGATIHREAHTGHTHATKVQEVHGVRIRTVAALCPPDSWHSENAFVGNVRSAEGFIWNKDAGLVGTAIYNVPEDK